jgi:uncharacterized BrkB/YihY/UPF0761 family membrane protein
MGNDRTSGAKAGAPVSAKHNKNASDAALEFAKHLITLSSGVFALTATFLTHFDHVPRWSLTILLSAWICLAISVAAGLKTISRIIGSRLHDNDDWSDKNGELVAKTSRWSFFAGIILLGAFGAVALLLVPKFSAITLPLENHVPSPTK